LKISSRRFTRALGANLPSANIAKVSGLQKT